jgi:hypothetical protein
MSDQTKVLEDKVTDQQKAELFLKEYQELCEKHQMQIIVTPAYKVSQDTGTWSTVLQVSVGKLPKRE